MLSLPSRFAKVTLAFAPVFLQQRTWCRAEVLLIGAVLAPGQRTEASILRITGLARERRFVNYHRILNRAAWSGRAAACVVEGHPTLTAVAEALLAAREALGEQLRGFGKRLRDRARDDERARLLMTALCWVETARVFPGAVSAELCLIRTEEAGGRPRW